MNDCTANQKLSNFIGFKQPQHDYFTTTNWSQKISGICTTNHNIISEQDFAAASVTDMIIAPNIKF